LTALQGTGLRLTYGHRVVADGLDIGLPAGQVSVLVGPNACGKSTLLRAMARLMTPRAGRVVLDGKDLHKLPTKEVARTLGLLPQ
jgi:iron complex transport system ATP-binding protein